MVLLGLYRPINLMKKRIHDWDLTTDATPEELQEMFHHAFYENRFGTVGIPFKHPVTNEERFMEI